MKLSGGGVVAAEEAAARRDRATTEVVDGGGAAASWSTAVGLGRKSWENFRSSDERSRFDEIRPASHLSFLSHIIQVIPFSVLKEEQNNSSNQSLFLHQIYRTTRMMSATIRRKALSLCSSALANNGIVRSLEGPQSALAGSASRGYVAGIPMFEEFGKKSKLVPEFHQGAPVYSNHLRDVVSSFKRDFLTQKGSRSFSTYSEPAKIDKMVNSSVKRTHNGPAYFTAYGAVAGSVLSAPIVNAPQAAKLGMGSTVSSTFLPSLALFWHINNGIEEILADYVHHEMTRSLILVLMRLFLIVAAKDVFVATN
ncbi:hypothetical protein SSX86_013035 [Deinandra increscens subsp. villosa]|uniref:Uncharacterized protein n=1 Tax=Deinandra increscens subsp. villosa TaxID=3103831 RepID=A0AAP0DCW4_9ASTR